jgi:hypothetical protein
MGAEIIQAETMLSVFVPLMNLEPKAIKFLFLHYETPVIFYDFCLRGRTITIV